MELALNLGCGLRYFRPPNSVQPIDESFREDPRTSMMKAIVFPRNNLLFEVVIIILLLKLG